MKLDDIVEQSTRAYGLWFWNTGVDNLPRVVATRVSQRDGVRLTYLHGSFMGRPYDLSGRFDPTMAETAQLCQEAYACGGVVLHINIPHLPVAMELSSMVSISDGWRHEFTDDVLKRSGDFLVVVDCPWDRAATIDKMSKRHGMPAKEVAAVIDAAVARFTQIERKGNDEWTLISDRS